MNIEVRYLSKSGNTKKIAEAIAEEVGVSAKPITQSVPAGTDILFLGGAVYAFGIDEELKQFIADLNPSDIGKVAVFSTTAVVKSAYPHVKKELDARGLSSFDKSFNSRGAFKFMHKGRPNAGDIAGAKAFARAIIG
ncbi:MAG: flavodoxin [Clostridiales Family XIII bacterium]|jgi:flavodoxin|nr:flavodoxin [Clostridiales Family XIII bacterium]